MKRFLITVVLSMAVVGVAQAGGLLIPVEPDLAPLAIVNHRVNVVIEDQVAVTKVEQTFRNHTDRRLEATFVFPVPAGASVREFAMWVNGSRVDGELVTAAKAQSMYANIVRQTQNPALLDYIGSDMLRMKIFPVEPTVDQKVEVHFTGIAKRDLEVIEYVYPLKTDRSAASTLEEFQLAVTLKSQSAIGNIYSPTHEIAVKHKGDHEAIVQYEQIGTSLDQDFKLYYTNSGHDIGVTALEHRPISNENGYVMLLISPRAELSQTQKVPRDIVFVVDTSGSMIQDNKIEQAKAALQQCLAELEPSDRFAVMNFATTVNCYRDHLVTANDEHVKAGMGWVADLYAGGGTAIHQALTTALEMRGGDSERMFTVVFFTDGQPTIGKTDTVEILADVASRNTANTRIFSFGLGNDLNAVFLDQIAEQTRALSIYVRPEQDIAQSVAGFFEKIHHPVLANLKLSTSNDVQLTEVYPPRLPDLFHGDQLVILARYQGSGRADVLLDGMVGTHERQFVYDLNFQFQNAGKPFVEELWARRKVGYLLDQIRINGEQQELIDEVVQLATNYGIATPYTSYLIMPDVPLQLAAAQSRDGAGRLGFGVPPALSPSAFGLEGAGKSQAKVDDFARHVQRELGQLAQNRGRFQDRQFEEVERFERRPTSAQDLIAAQPQVARARKRMAMAKQRKATLDMAQSNYRNGEWRRNQVQKLGVDLSVCTNSLKCQSRVQATAVRRVAGRNCMEIGGVWIDEAFTENTKTVAIKAQSDAYFRILERQPRIKDVFGLGNHIVWITPNGTGMVIDTTDGMDQISDQEISMLFAGK